MGKKLRTLISTLLLASAVLLLSSCGKKLPTLEEAAMLSEEELQKCTSGADEKALIKAWGEPQIVNSQDIWKYTTDGGERYITAWANNGNITSIGVSKPLYVTVAAIEETTVYGFIGTDDYTTEESAFAVLPAADLFGNEISYEEGDLYYFQFDGMIMESYPLQVNTPYSAELTGHLSEEELEEIHEMNLQP